MLKRGLAETWKRGSETAKWPKSRTKRSRITENVTPNQKNNSKPPKPWHYHKLPLIINKNGWAKAIFTFPKVNGIYGTSKVVDWKIDKWDILLTEEHTGIFTAHHLVAGDKSFSVSGGKTCFCLGWIRAKVHRLNLDIKCSDIQQNPRSKDVNYPFRGGGL